MMILLCGEYKTGKTVSACTFPKPMIYFDFDRGLGSAKHTTSKSGEKVVENFEDIHVVDFTRESAAPLEFKTSMQGSRAPLHTKESPGMIKRYNDTIKSLFEQKDQEPYQSLVIDSLTTMFRVWKEAILQMNSIPALRIPDYGTLEGILFGQFIPTLKTLNKTIPYIILIDHEAMDKDEVSGKVMEFPIGPSVNQGKALGKEFDEIWRMRVEGGKHVWRTKKSGFFQAGSRLNLPDPIEPATFKTLSKYLK